jgi:uncharacterized membrane protein YhaH (DUF805 family)
MNWYVKVLKDYVKFDGRARRQEYWMFFLINVIISAVLSVIDMAIGMRILTGLYSLALLLPSLGVAVRRLHDTGKSGWFLFIGFIPLIGAIWLIVVLATAGTTGDNEYGPDPKTSDPNYTADKSILDSNVNV